MACLVQNNSTSSSTAHLPAVHENLSKKRKLASPNHFKNKRVQRIHDTSTSPPWTPLFPSSRLEQDAITYIHKFYCKDCQMDQQQQQQQAAERAQRGGAGGGSTGEESSGSGAGLEPGSAADVKHEPGSPMSPQQQTDEASLMVTLDKNKESLKRKLLMRRSLHELVDQGIYPSPKTPLAFVEQKKSLERAKIGDSLRFKISHRPDRQQLVQQHILEDTNIDPSLHERQRLLKKARLADSLNDKLSHRPGVLELVQGNIIQTDDTLSQLIKEGSLSFDKSVDLEHYTIEGSSYGCEDSKSSDEAFSPDQTDDSNMSDISSPPVLQQQTEQVTSFSKPLSLTPNIQFHQPDSSKGTIAFSSTPTFSIPAPSPISGISFTAGTFPSGGFVTPRSNVTVSTINNNKSRPKKAKQKPQPKSKVIKFHEYKGPPNIVKSTQPVGSTPASVAAVGLVNTTTSCSISNNITAQSILTTAQQQAQAAVKAGSDTPYHILLQQQQLFLQWQLEFNQNQKNQNMKAAVLLPSKMEGQPGFQTMTSLVSSASSSLGSSMGSSLGEPSVITVVTQSQPPQTVFTVTPTSQHGQPGAPLQQIRISSPPSLPQVTQVKQEPPLGQPQPQMNPSITPTTSTNKPVKKPTVNINTATPPKQFSSLEEMKVPELKVELKKRNLTVSGTKNQLIERLKPYADAIIKPKERPSPGSISSPGSSVMSPTSSILSSLSVSSPQPFSVLSPPSSVTSSPSAVMTKTVVISPPGSMLGSSSGAQTMTLPVVLSSSGILSRPGSVTPHLTSPGSTGSASCSSAMSPSCSLLSRPGSMAPVGDVIDEILSENAESPLADIQSMQSAVSVTNMTMIPDDISNPFSPPDSPAMMMPLSPDLMDMAPSPVSDLRQHVPANLGPSQGGPASQAPTLDQSPPGSVLSVVPSEADMDTDLDLSASLGQQASGLPPASMGLQHSDIGHVMNGGVPVVSQQAQVSMQSEVFRSQVDQQQMLNHIQEQLRVLQENQQKQQQQQQAGPSRFQLSQEELLRQQQEKIEKLQAQLQQSQLQLKLQQIQHQQLQHQQQKLQQLQQQTLQQQQQQQQQTVCSQPGVSLVSPGRSQACSIQQQVAVDKPAPPVLSSPVSQPAQVSPHQNTVISQPQQGPRQITVQVPTTTVAVPPTSTQVFTVPTSSVGQKPAPQPVTTQTTTTPQVIFSVPNGTKAPMMANLPANMKQIQIPASWLTNIQSTPQGVSAVIVPQVRKTKPPSLEFIKHQTINQSLLGGKSVIAVSTGVGGQQQFIIAAAPQATSATPATSTSTNTPAFSQNGLMKPTQQKMTVSLPASPVEGTNHTSVTRTASNPFFIPMKEPPKYDEAVRIKQSKTPESAGVGGSNSPEKSQTMDDVLEILIRTGELPASAAQPSTPVVTTQSRAGEASQHSLAGSMAPPAIDVKSEMDTGYSDYQEMTDSNHGIIGMSGLNTTSVKSEQENMHNCDNTVTVFPPMDNAQDFFDLNDVINSDLNTMDWTPDPAFGDLDLTDTTGMNACMDLGPTDPSLLTIPHVHSPQKSNSGSEPDLNNLGLADMDTNSHMQIDVPDWLDVIMPSTGFTPVSSNAPVSFPADPILTPQTQKEVLDLFNFDDADLNTPSDLNYGSAWDKLTETTSS